MKPTIVIIAALESELPAGSLPAHMHLIYTGIGKVNAAIATTRAILSLKPALVVNYGTAGKINSAVEGLLEVAKVVQRDMLAMPLAARGVTPLSSDPSALFSGGGTAVCGTGDSFVTSSDDWLLANGIDIVDMELFAIAHACARFNIPWKAFKYITDDANTSSGNDWQSNIHRGQDLFSMALDAALLAHAFPD